MVLVLDHLCIQGQLCCGSCPWSRGQGLQGRWKYGRHDPGEDCSGTRGHTVQYGMVLTKPISRQFTEKKPQVDLKTYKKKNPKTKKHIKRFPISLIMRKKKKKFRTTLEILFFIYQVLAKIKNRTCVGVASGDVTVQSPRRERAELGCNHGWARGRDSSPSSWCSRYSPSMWTDPVHACINTKLWESPMSISWELDSTPWAICTLGTPRTSLKPGEHSSLADTKDLQGIVKGKIMV